MAQASLQAGVSGVLVPGFGPERWPRQLQLLRESLPLRVELAFGLHPWAIADYRVEEALRRLSEGWQAWSENPEVAVRALGEFGLDRSPRGLRAPWPEQEAVFRWHLQQAKQARLPVILHLVRADGPAESLLASFDGGFSGVVHSFSSHHQMIPRFRELGLSFSYSSSVFHSKKVQESLKRTPREHIMFETDAPWGTSRHFPEGTGPECLPEVLAAASQVLEKSVEWCRALHRDNCERIFGLGAWSSQ